jgi:hypothetical protein
MPILVTPDLVPMDEFSHGKAKLRIKTDAFEYGTEIDQFQWKFAIRILGKWGKTPRGAASKWQQRGDRELQEAERLGNRSFPKGRATVVTFSLRSKMERYIPYV